MGQEISYSRMDVRDRSRSDNNIKPVSPVLEPPSFNINSNVVSMQEVAPVLKVLFFFNGNKCVL